MLSSLWLLIPPSKRHLEASLVSPGHGSAGNRPQILQSLHQQGPHGCSPFVWNNAFFVNRRHGDGVNRQHRGLHPLPEDGGNDINDTVVTCNISTKSDSVPSRFLSPMPKDSKVLKTNVPRSQVHTCTSTHTHNRPPPILKVSPFNTNCQASTLGWCCPGSMDGGVLVTVRSSLATAELLQRQKKSEPSTDGEGRSKPLTQWGFQHVWGAPRGNPS